MKYKIFFLNLLIIIGLTFSFSLIKISAQESFPTGGSDFDSASEIKPGQYQGGVLEWDEEAGITKQVYYLSNVKNGQLIQAKLMFSGNTNIDLRLYDVNKRELVSVYGGDDIDTLVWLTGATSEAGKYYLSIKNDAIDRATNMSLGLKLVDYYDASSSTDAGETIDKALPISPGTYQGYLASEEFGRDKFDYYQLTLKKGVRTTVKITPPNQDSINLKVYDVNKTMLDEKTPNNEGEITSLSFTPANDGKYYLGLECYYGCKTTINYQMEISGAVLPTGGGLIATGSPQTTGEPSTVSPTSAVVSTLPLLANSRDKIYILIIVATVLAVIIIVAILLRKKSPEKKEEQPNPVQKSVKDEKSN